MHIWPFFAQNALKTVKISTLGRLCNSRSAGFGEEGSCRRKQPCPLSSPPSNWGG